jgi:hypothetical protein
LPANASSVATADVAISIAAIAATATIANDFVLFIV